MVVVAVVCVGDSDGVVAVVGGFGSTTYQANAGACEDAVVVVPTELHAY